jgi:HD-like signal output (HDOD) protein
MNKSVLSTAFYDVMFPESCGRLSLLEAEIIKRVKSTLSDRALLSTKLQPLPALQMELVSLLNNQHVEYAKVAELINKDPALSLKVLKIVNSAQNTSGFVITDLSTAVARLGMNGIASIASAIMMKSINPPKPIYYKLYGRQIWSHSLQCAYLCKEFSKLLEQDEFFGHFLGLVHDVGKILVFECLVDTMTSTSLSHELGSQEFREEITGTSLDVSYFVAREWGLPDLLCDALQQQRTSIKSPLAIALHTANQCAEYYLLRNRINLDEGDLPLMVRQDANFMQSWQTFLDHGDELTISV